MNIENLREKLRRKIGLIVEGAPGFRMTEAIARKIDKLSKSLPKECQHRRGGIIRGAS